MSDVLDEATREARDRLHCTGSLPAPTHRAEVYARAVMQVVEIVRGEGEDFYDAYLRVRGRPSLTVVALVLTHRDQFGRERRALMH